MYERYTCNYCNSRLDPGEHCDCQKKRIEGKEIKEKAKAEFERLMVADCEQLELFI